MQDDIDYLLELGFVRTKSPSLDDEEDYYFIYGYISCTHIGNHKYWGMGNIKFYHSKGIQVGSLRGELLHQLIIAKKENIQRAKETLDVLESMEPLCKMI